jgi:hypothetical protein
MNEPAESAIPEKRMAAKGRIRSQNPERFPEGEDADVAGAGVVTAEGKERLFWRQRNEIEVNHG